MKRVVEQTARLTEVCRGISEVLSALAGRSLHRDQIRSLVDDHLRGREIAAATFTGALKELSDNGFVTMEGDAYTWPDEAKTESEPILPGNAVRFSRTYLKNTNQFSGPATRRTGTVLKLRGEQALVRWTGAADPQPVSIERLERSPIEGAIPSMKVTESKLLPVEVVVHKTGRMRHVVRRAVRTAMEVASVSDYKIVSSAEQRRMRREEGGRVGAPVPIVRFKATKEQISQIREMLKKFHEDGWVSVKFHGPVAEALEGTRFKQGVNPRIRDLMRKYDLEIGTDILGKSITPQGSEIVTVDTLRTVDPHGKGMKLARFSREIGEYVVTYAPADLGIMGLEKGVSAEEIQSDLDVLIDAVAKSYGGEMKKVSRFRSVAESTEFKVWGRSLLEWRSLTFRRDPTQVAQRRRYYQTLKESANAPVQWSFDLTGFGKPEAFETFLTSLGIKPVGQKTPDGMQFIWRGKDVTLVTHCNPVTGEFRNAIDPSRLGYASYMAIAGPELKVARARKALQKLSKEIASPSDPLEFAAVPAEYFPVTA